MEFSKKKLLSIINEVNDMDIDEAQHKNPISRPLKNQNGELIGHDMRVDPFDEDSPRVNVIFTCDIDEFIRNHPDLVKKLTEQYGNIKWTDDYCPKHRPHLKGAERQYYPLPGQEQGTEIIRKKISIEGSKSVRENIARKLNPLLRRELENEELTRHLEICSVPPIKPTKRTHVDTHSMEDWDNDNIVYKTHSLDFYKSTQDFLKSVVARVKGDTPEYDRGLYIPRQYNKKTVNWDPTKKTEKFVTNRGEIKKKWFGYTPIYNLKKKGFEEKDLDVMVQMHFEINGTRVGSNGYTWTITFITEYGKKLKDDLRVKRLTQDKKFVITKEVPENPEDNREFTDSYTVLDNFEIFNALEEGMEELKEKLMSIDKREALRLANIKSYEVNEIFENYLRKKIRNLLG